MTGLSVCEPMYLIRSSRSHVSESISDLSFNFGNADELGHFVPVIAVGSGVVRFVRSATRFESASKFRLFERVYASTTINADERSPDVTAKSFSRSAGQPLAGQGQETEPSPLAHVTHCQPPHST